MRGSHEKLRDVLKRDRIVAAESLMEKSGDANADSDLFIKLYEIARARFPGTDSEKMKCDRW